jgi:hypothetical protein
MLLVLLKSAYTCEVRPNLSTDSGPEIIKLEPLKPLEVVDCCYNGRFFELSNKKATQNLHTKVECRRKSTKKGRKLSLMHRKTPELHPKNVRIRRISSHFCPNLF